MASEDEQQEIGLGGVGGLEVGGGWGGFEATSASENWSWLSLGLG